MNDPFALPFVKITDYNQRNHLAPPQSILRLLNRWYQVKLHSRFQTVPERFFIYKSTV